MSIPTPPPPTSTSRPTPPPSTSIPTPPTSTSLPPPSTSIPTPPPTSIPMPLSLPHLSPPPPLSLLPPPLSLPLLPPPLSFPAPRSDPPPEKVQTPLYRPPELPGCGHLKMTVSAIGEDGLIYAKTRHAAGQFERLQVRLQQQIRGPPIQKRCTWRSVRGCAVLGPDMLWYRGEVMEVIGGHVKVRDVDQGLVENIPVCHVYPTILCEDVPQLCVPCQLYGVIPVGWAWQADAVALLKELLISRTVDVIVMALPAYPRGCVTVQVFLGGATLSSVMLLHQHASLEPAAATTLEEPVLTACVPSLDAWDIDTEGLEGLDMEPVLGVFSYTSLPETGEHFPVRIRHQRTPNEVFLSPLLEARCEEAEGESLEEALRRVNQDIEELPLLSDFPMEGPCLAEYSDGKYYRAKLLGFVNFNPVKLLVRHVDFGSDDSLPTDKLRQIPPSLLRFPCNTLKVCLSGFRPPEVDLEKERLPYQPEWSMKATREMLDLLHGNNLTASVQARHPELSVFLYDEAGALVHLPLVKRGLADSD